MLPKLRLKLFPVFITILTISLFIGQFSFGQSQGAESISSPQSETEKIPTTPNGQQNLHYYTQNVVLELMAAVSCQLTGIDPMSPQGKCLGIDQKTGKIAPAESNGGAIGFMGGLIAQTFEIPISTHDYIAHSASRFGIVKNTYAGNSINFNNSTTGVGNGISTKGSIISNNGILGTGFKTLSPLIPVWQALTNVVYLFFVVIFTIVGLAILLRIKIDPRTVYTIQNQLPKIVVGLILVTFSYAIVGFLIDVMWLATYLVFTIFSGSPNIHVDLNPVNPAFLQGKNPLSAIGGWGGLGWITKDSAGSVGNIISSLFGGTAGRLVAGLITGLIGGLIGSHIPGHDIPLAGSLVTAAFTLGGVLYGELGGNAVLNVIGSMIAFLIIAIAILWALFRLWFNLIRCYIFLLLDLILAPFWIAAGILPGKPLGFDKWLRDVISNLAVFPATIFLFIVGKILIDSVGSVTRPDRFFIPPLIGNPGQPNALASILGLGIILLAPQVVQMVRDAIKPPQNKYAAGVGQAIGVGQQVAGAGLGQAWGRLTRPYNSITGTPAGQLRRYVIGRDQEESNATWRKIARGVLGWHEAPR